MTNSMADPQYRAMSMQMPVRQQTSVQMPMYQQCMQVPGDMQMQVPMHHHSGMPQQMQYMMQQQSGGYDQYDGQDGLDM